MRATPLICGFVRHACTFNRRTCSFMNHNFVGGRCCHVKAIDKSFLPRKQDPRSTTASPLSLLAAACSKIGPSSDAESVTPLAESLVARTISKSHEEEQKSRALLHQQNNIITVPGIQGHFIQVGHKSVVNSKRIRLEFRRHRATMMSLVPG